MKDKGNHTALSEHWLIDNLPERWTYDCVTSGEQQGFLIYPPSAIEFKGDENTPLFIPLDLLKRNRNNREFRKVEINDPIRRGYKAY